jgi:hypothetical protein
MNVKQWIEKQRHLPRFMRDFHDAKDLFKSIHQWDKKAGEPPYGISWSGAQIYVIDTFLRFMAYHGYVLQKTRRKGDYCDIHMSLRDYEKERDESAAKALNDYLASRKPTAVGEG